MNVRNFEEAYANLLVSDDARAALATEPERIRRQFSLTDAELTALRSVDRSRLELSAETVKGVRVRVLQRALPEATRALAGWASGDEVLDSYLRRCPPFREASPNRLLAEAARFVRFAGGDGCDHVPAYIREVATFEELRLRLAYDRRAGDAARACQTEAARWLETLETDPAQLAGASFALGAHVALAAFDHDVVAITGNGGRDRVEQHRRPTWLIVKRSHERMTPLVYRIGEVPYEFFRRLDGTTRLGQIGSDVFEGGPPERAIGLVRMGLEHALLVVPSSSNRHQS